MLQIRSALAIFQHHHQTGALLQLEMRFSPMTSQITSQGFIEKYKWLAFNPLKRCAGIQWATKPSEATVPRTTQSSEILSINPKNSYLWGRARFFLISEGKANSLLLDQGAAELQEPAEEDRQETEWESQQESPTGWFFGKLKRKNNYRCQNKSLNRKKPAKATQNFTPETSLQQDIDP